MSTCCPPGGYDLVFDRRQAARDARRFRRKGLTWAPARTVTLLRGIVEGRTVLEVGGGIGDLQIALLGAGATQATSVELSPGYEATATVLLREAGLEHRVRRLVGDLATDPAVVDPADIVVLHSVVCCYPDAAALLTAAAAKARTTLVISYPRDVWWLRAWAPVQNLYPRLRGSGFRFIVHAPATIIGTVERAGFRVTHTERNRVDHLTVFRRVAGGPAGPG